MRKNRLQNNRESSSTYQLVRISSHENNEQKLEKDERLLEVMRGRLVKGEGTLTALSVDKEISSSRACMSKAPMNHARLTKKS